MMDWRQRYEGKLVSPERAVSEIKSGEKVVLSGGNLRAIVNALARRHQELRGVTVVGGGAQGGSLLLNPGYEESFECWETFLSPRIREAIWQKRAHFCNEPFSFSNPWRLLEPGRASVNLGGDWAVIAVAPPNANGYCSFGQAVNYSKSKAETARKVIAIVNEDYPWTYGETIHVSRIEYLVEAEPVPAGEIPRASPTPEDEARSAKVIGSLASGLIRDGDTVQVGTGATPGAVESFLSTKNDLGIHTESLSHAAILEVIKTGAVTCKKKNVNHGKVIISFLLGGPGSERWEECRDLFDHNPLFEFRDLSYTNSIPVIASNDNMVAVNGIIGVDLLGQAVTDYVGTTPMTGVGGNLDFTIGSHYSRGGRSIHVLLSTAKGGTLSRIVPRFPEGAPVTCPRFYLDYLVTEHGVVNLEGLTPRKRADAIISVAHPDFRPELRREAKEMFGA